MNLHTTGYYKLLEKYTDKDVFVLDVPGGMRASKTYSLTQLDVEYGLRQKQERIIKIIGMSVPHLRDNIIQDFRNVCIDYGIPFDQKYKESKRSLEINNTKYLFLSADVDNVLGGQADITHVNEANARVFKWETIQQLIYRTKTKFIFEYNPKNKFWKHAHIDEIVKMGYDKVCLTYKHNEYCPAGIKQNLDGAKEGTWFYNVFVLGEEAMPEGIIYTNWVEGYWKEGIPYVYAIDFGSTDPECIIKVGYDKDENKTYVEEMYYDKSINKGTQGIIDAALFVKKKDHDEAQAKVTTLFKEVNFNPVFIPDPAGKDKIVDMKKKGLNCPKFVKPELVWSIRNLQSRNEIVVCGNSYHIKEELGSYVWKDLDGGIPEDQNNHTLDAIRYGDRYLTSKGVGINRNVYAKENYTI